MDDTTMRIFLFCFVIASNTAICEVKLRDRFHLLNWITKLNKFLEDGQIYWDTLVSVSSFSEIPNGSLIIMVKRLPLLFSFCNTDHNFENDGKTAVF